MGWKHPKNINLLHAFGIQVPFYCNYGHFQKNNEIFEKIRFFEKFHDFSENGRSCNEMALKYQRHVKD